ncbi:hypothetical protein EW145_g1584 [Phellinidium pouzarii]|uniref:Mediator complex subunit 18 n=1 Tax=Phellinidium pouzarii TaxID=167371 RepID=A0A4S4LEA8_9AGAM|nr:hypothetical protein EW145_g1584 [Phellinidium pouzarii]
MSTLYEVALYGEFFARDLKPILNRLILHSESATRMHSREVVFEPLDAQMQRDQGVEPVFLRCRKELAEPGSGCGSTRIMYSYLKAESVRQHPEATVRPWATCHVSEDALSFASALGYVDQRTQKPIPAHADTLWEVEVRTANPVRNTQETPLSQSIDAVLEVQLLMKGLLDLRRQDA